jgi:hypothetical protein
MDIEFHYYVTYVLAERCFFSKEESHRLAYSSQYTDDNSFYYYVNLPDGGYYISQISQTMNITTPSKRRQTIYPIFHFMPGDPDSPTARRGDGRKHLLNTTPGNANAEKLLDDALATGNLYRIGIAAHCFADTWSHQNFVGLEDDFNDIRGVGVLIPGIGHAHAGHEPDTVHNEWMDDRLVEELRHINNNHRFLEAAENIFRKFWERPGGPGGQWEPKWEALRPELENAMSESFLYFWDAKARQKAYGKLIDGGMPGYDPDVWRHAAVNKEELEIDFFDRYWAREGFADSEWRAFQDAVKEHREAALVLLRPLYAAADCPLWPAEGAVVKKG